MAVSERLCLVDDVSNFVLRRKGGGKSQTVKLHEELWMRSPRYAFARHESRNAFKRLCSGGKPPKTDIGRAKRGEPEHKEYCQNDESEKSEQGGENIRL